MRQLSIQRAAERESWLWAGPGDGSVTARLWAFPDDCHNHLATYFHTTAVSILIE